MDLLLFLAIVVIVSLFFLHPAPRALDLEQENRDWKDFHSF